MPTQVFIPFFSFCLSCIPFLLLAQGNNTPAKNQPGITIENLGAPINSEFFEYAPLIMADASMLIFTYRGKKSKGGLQNEYGNLDLNGKYFEDIMVSYMNNGKWSEPRSISDSLNTNLHDACIALTADGQKLLVYKDNIGKSSGDIYISALDSNEWQKPRKMKNINSNFWEGSATISADMKTIYFTSTRKGGMGGRDIYMSKLSKDGEWETPANVGSPVNTKYDEDSPFLHPDGVTLYFSSNGHNTTGGYDIFISHLALDTNAKNTSGSFQWSKPENIGDPVNTAGDEKYYVVSADGNTAYFSSERPGGYGLSDIYIVHQKEKHMLILIKGKVFANDRATESDIIVSFSEPDKAQGSEQYELRGMYKSNSASGKYMMIFNSAGIYMADFSVPGFTKKTEYFSSSKLDTFVEIYRDVDIYSPGYVSPYANIDGTLFGNDDTTKPLEGITVFLKNNSGQVTEQITVGKDGHFTFRRVPKDDHYFITLSTNKDVLIKGNVLSAGKPFNGLKLNNTASKEDGSYRLLIKGKHYLDIEGDVIYAERNEKPQFIQVFLNSDNGFSRQTLTDKDGHYKFEGLPDGEKYNFSLSADKNTIVKGVVTSDDHTKKGVLINEILTGDNGQFEFDIAGKSEFECANFFIELTGWNKVDLADEKFYADILSKYGNVSAEGLIFKVQIGAYRNPANFNYDVFGDLGKINSQLLKDGLTRFTIGEFKTLNEAENLKRKARQRGKKDSFITFYCRGERKLLSEAIGGKFRQ